MPARRRSVFGEWERGWEILDRLPRWLLYVILPFYAVLELVILRPWIVFTATAGSFALLAYLKIQIVDPSGNTELDWGTLALLSAGVFWIFPIMIAVMFPMLLGSVGLLQIVAILERRGTITRRPSRRTSRPAESPIPESNP